MIQGRWIAPGDPLDLILPLREKIFGAGQDALDAISWNALIYAEDEPAGIGRIWWEEGAYHLGMIGVDPQRRGRKLGDLVTRLLLFKAQQHAAREIRLCCPKELCAFFAAYGFEPQGEKDAQVLMTLDGAVLCLDSCQGCAHRD